MNLRTRILMALACATVGVASAQTKEAAPTATAAAVRVNESMRQLRTAGMSAPATAPSSTSLQEAIDRIRRLKVGGGRVATVAPTPAPVRTQPVENTQDAPPARPRRLLSDDVLAKLEKLPLAGVADPVAMADAVHRAGIPDTAYVLYEKILAAGDERTPTDWVLLQMASCVRGKDPKVARRLYAKLMAECPKSHWLAVAKVQHDLLAWFEANSTDVLLAAQTQPAGP